MNKQNEEAAAPQVVYVNDYNGQLVGKGYPGGVAYIREDVMRKALMKAWKTAYEWGECDPSVPEMGAIVQTNVAMNEILKGGKKK